MPTLMYIKILISYWGNHNNESQLLHHFNVHFSMLVSIGQMEFIETDFVQLNATPHLFPSKVNISPWSDIISWKIGNEWYDLYDSDTCLQYQDEKT